MPASAWAAASIAAVDPRSATVEVTKAIDADATPRCRDQGSARVAQTTPRSRAARRPRTSQPDESRSPRCGLLPATSTSIAIPIRAGTAPRSAGHVKRGRRALDRDRPRSARMRRRACASRATSAAVAGSAARPLHAARSTMTMRAASSSAPIAYPRRAASRRDGDRSRVRGEQIRERAAPAPSPTSCARPSTSRSCVAARPPARAA